MTQNEMTGQKIAVLKDARRRIAKHENAYVCVAIEKAGRDMRMNGVARGLLKVIGDIFERDGLNSCVSVGEWLHQKHGVYRFHLTCERLREYRLAWLDSWIGDLQKSIAVDDFPG